jgi:hypothetical protein
MGLVLNASFYWERKNGSKKQAFIRQKSEDQKWSAAKIDRVDAQEPVELQSPECEYGTCLLPPKTATSETRDMIGTSSKCQDPRANLWGWVGYRWVPEKIGRFTGLLKRSHGQSGWTYIGDPLKPQRYQGLCPWFPKLQGMPLSDQVGMFIYTV